MMNPMELDRKVRQLDNDVQSIYEMLADISATQRRQGNRLDEHSAILNEHTVTLNEHTVTLNEHSAILNEHSAILNDHTSKLDRIISLLEDGR